MIMKALKKWCEELKARLQAREIISSSLIYSERSKFQKILDSSLFTDEKNSIWKNWYKKVQKQATNQHWSLFKWMSQAELCTFQIIQWCS